MPMARTVTTRTTHQSHVRPDDRVMAVRSDVRGNRAARPSTGRVSESRSTVTVAGMLLAWWYGASSAVTSTFIR